MKTRNVTALIRRLGQDLFELELHGLGDNARTRRFSRAITTQRKLEHVRESPNRFGPDDLAVLGYELYGVLFPRREDQEDLTRLLDGPDPVVLDVASDEHEVHDLPWELLNPTGEKKDFLIPTGRISMVRSIPSAAALDLGPPPWRMLYVVSMPISAYRGAPIQVLEEHEAVRKAVQPWIRTGLLEIDILERSTPKELRGFLRGAESSYQIMHIIAHGTPGGLLMEDESDREEGREVLLPELSELIGEVSDLKVLVINACLSAASPAWGPSVGFAAARRLAPVVLANQTSIRIGTAMQSVSDFYKSLVEWRPLHLALDRFRKTAQVGWWQPVIYLPAQVRSFEKPTYLPEKRRPDPFEVKDLIEEAGAFIFRYEPVHALGEKLRSKSRILALHGVGGMGKSMLAAYAARFYRARFQGVFFIDLREKTALEMMALLVRRLAPETSRPALTAELTKTPPAEVLESLLEQDGARGFLLILDNAEVIQDERGHVRADRSEWSDIIELLRRHEDFTGRVLLTTRILPAGDERSTLLPVGGAIEIGELFQGELGLLVRLLGEQMGIFQQMWRRSGPRIRKDNPEVDFSELEPADFLSLGVASDIEGTFGRSPLLVRLAMNSLKEMPAIDPIKVFQQSGQWMDFYRDEQERVPDAWAPFLHMAFPISETLAAALGTLDGYRHLRERVRVLVECFRTTEEDGREVPHRRLYQPVELFLRANQAKDPVAERTKYYQDKLRVFLSDPETLSESLSRGPLTRADLFNLLDLALEAEEAGDVETVLPEFLELGLRILPEYQAMLLEDAFETIRDNGLRARVSFTLGALHQEELRNPDQAIEWYEKSMAIMQERGDRAGEAKSAHQIGLVHQQRNKFDQAIEWYEKSMAIFGECGDRAGEAGSAHQIGNVHLLRNEFDQAIEWYEKSMAIKQERGDRAREAKTAHQIGNVHLLRNELDQAIEWYEKSMAIKQERGDRAGEAGSAHQIGLVHQERNELDQAIEWYEKSMAITQECGDRAGEAMSAHQIGSVHQERSELDQAIEWYEKSKAIFGECGDRAGEAASTHQIGRVHQERNKLDEAAGAFERAYKLFAGRNDPRRLQALRLLLDVLGRLAENSVQAMDVFERWLERLLRETRAAMDAQESPRQVVPALRQAAASLERYKDLAPDRWNDAHKVFHDMERLLKQLSKDPGSLDD